MAALSLFRFFFFALETETSTLVSTSTDALSSSMALVVFRLFFLDFFSAAASKHYLAIRTNY